MSYGGGVVAAAAAAKRRRMMEQKEEQMTLNSYNKNDLEGWEFKIVRSSFGRFNSDERIRKVCEEEAVAGWELVEKFDNSRLRFKRRTSNRSGDQYRENGGYKTNSSVGNSMIAVIIGLFVLLAGGVLLFVMARGTVEISNPALFFSTLGIILLLAIIIILKRKNR